MEPLELSPSSIEAIARRVFELTSAPVATVDVMTLSEARVYVKRLSKPAFYDWCQKWDVRPRSHGRYSRAKLDLALEREAGTAHTPAAMKRQQLSRP